MSPFWLCLLAPVHTNSNCSMRPLYSFSSVTANVKLCSPRRELQVSAVCEVLASPTVEGCVSGARPVLDRHTAAGRWEVTECRWSSSDRRGRGCCAPRPTIPADEDRVGNLLSAPVRTDTHRAKISQKPESGFSFPRRLGQDRPL